MANNTDPLSPSEVQHYTNYWCKQMGFKNRDLGITINKDGRSIYTKPHPQIDDVLLLVQWTNEFWDCPGHWKKQIEKIWTSVYKEHKPLQQAQLEALTFITKGIIKWRKKRIFDRTKIKSLRQRL